MKTRKKIKTKIEGSPRIINKSALMLVTSVLLVAGSIFYIVESSSLGSRLASVEKKEKTLKLENRELSDQLVEFDSLTKIASKEEELSFIKPSKFLYIKLPESVANAF